MAPLWRVLFISISLMCGLWHFGSAMGMIFVKSDADPLLPFLLVSISLFSTLPATLLGIWFARASASWLLAAAICGDIGIIRWRGIGFMPLLFTGGLMAIMALGFFLMAQNPEAS